VPSLRVVDEAYVSYIMAILIRTILTTVTCDDRMCCQLNFDVDDNDDDDVSDVDLSHVNNLDCDDESTTYYSNELFIIDEEDQHAAGLDGPPAMREAAAATAGVESDVGGPASVKAVQFDVSTEQLAGKSTSRPPLDTVVTRQRKLTLFEKKLTGNQPLHNFFC